MTEVVKRRDIPYRVLPEQIAPDPRTPRCEWCGQRLPANRCGTDGSAHWAIDDGRLCHWCATGTGIR